MFCPDKKFNNIPKISISNIGSISKKVTNIVSNRSYNIILEEGGPYHDDRAPPASGHHLHYVDRGGQYSIAQAGQHPAGVDGVDIVSVGHQYPGQRDGDAGH